MSAGLATVGYSDRKPTKLRWGIGRFSRNPTKPLQLPQLSTQTSYDYKTYFIRLALTSSLLRSSLPVKPAMPRPRKELDEFSLNTSFNTSSLRSIFVSGKWSKSRLMLVRGKLDRLLCKSKLLVNGHCQGCWQVAKVGTTVKARTTGQRLGYCSSHGCCPSQWQVVGV
jgi:hypothetical protein